MLNLFLHPKDLEIILCSPPDFVDRKQKFNQSEKLACKELFLSHFQDPNLMYSLSCYLQWLLHSSSFQKYKTTKKKIPFLIQQQKQKFQKDAKYLKKGVSGEVFSSEFIDHFPIIIKYAKRWDSFTDILHEYAIAMFGTNKLRYICPNYSYSFALYQNPNFTNRGLVMEKIPGMTFLEMLEIYIEKRDSKYIINFLKVFFQLILALELGQETVFFTHYDLHYNNVMVRELPEPLQEIYYQVFNKIYRIKNVNLIPTVIDFGHASIKTKEGYIGKGFHNSFSVEGMYPFYIPGADLFKIIMGSYCKLFINVKDKTIKFKPIDQASIGFKISNFFKKIITEFFQINIWDVAYPNYVDPKVFFRPPDVTQFNCVYNSPLNLLDFLERKKMDLCQICGISDFPWAKSNNFQFVGTFIPKNIPEIANCYQGLYCSKVKTPFTMKNVFETTWNTTEITDNSPAEIIFDRVYTTRQKIITKPIPKLNLNNARELMDYLGDRELWNNFEIYMNSIMTSFRLGKPLPQHVGEFYYKNLTTLQYFYRVYICIKGFLSYLYDLHGSSV